MSRASEHLAELRAAQRAAALDAATRRQAPPLPVPTPNLAFAAAAARLPPPAFPLAPPPGFPALPLPDPRVLAAMAAQAAVASGAPVLAPLHQSPHLALPPGLAAVCWTESRYRPSFLIYDDICTM